MTVFQTCILLYCALASSLFAAFRPSHRWGARKVSVVPLPHTHVTPCINGLLAWGGSLVIAHHLPLGPLRSDGRFGALMDLLAHTVRCNQRCAVTAANVIE